MCAVDRSADDLIHDSWSILNEKSRRTELTDDEYEDNEDGLCVLRQLFDEDKAYYRHDEESIISSDIVVSSSAPAHQLALQFHLPLNSSDVLEGNYSVMPSLRLDMLKREYHEPVRDRDKDWCMKSQRDIMNSSVPDSKLELGRYKAREAIGALSWSPALQRLVRRVHICTKGAVISHTYCNVEVFGLGLSGRLVSEGGNNVNRFLIIEAYSVWNSVKYVLMLPATHLRAILASDAALLKTGRRKKAIDDVIKRLYFEYDVELPSSPCAVRCRHLAPLCLPAGLPQSIPEVMQAVQNPPIDKAPSVQLKQELFVGTSVLESGPSVSRRTYLQRLADEEKDLARERQLWLDTPLRLRGLVHCTARRIAGKLAIVAMYRLPRQPVTMSVRMHLSIECAAIQLALPLATAAAGKKGAVNPHSWPKLLVQSVAASSAQKIALTWTDTAYCCLVFAGLFSPTHRVQPLKSVSFPSSRRSLNPHSEPLCLQLSGEPSNDFIASVFSTDRLAPRREVGRGLRITSRAAVIQGATVILTIYLRSPLIRGPLPSGFNLSLVISADGQIDYDLMNAYFTSLCLALDVDIEVYSPTQQELCGHILPSCSTLCAVMNRDDLFRLTGRDMPQFVHLSRVCYEEYYGHQPYEMRREVKAAWNALLRKLVEMAQWGVANDLGTESTRLERDYKDAQRKLFIVASQVDPSAYSRVQNSKEIKCTQISEVVLLWSSEIFRKSMYIDQEGGKPKLLQMVMWQQGEKVGVIAYDLSLREVLMVEDSLRGQRSQIESFRCLSETERLISVSIYMTLGVRYFIFEENEQELRGIKLVDAIDELNVDISIENFTEQATAATDKATEAIQRRLRAAKKIQEN